MRVQRSEGNRARASAARQNVAPRTASMMGRAHAMHARTNAGGGRASLVFDGRRRRWYLEALEPAA